MSHSPTIRSLGFSTLPTKKGKILLLQAPSHRQLTSCSNISPWGVASDAELSRLGDLSSGNRQGNIRFGDPCSGNSQGNIRLGDLSSGNRQGNIRLGDLSSGNRQNNLSSGKHQGNSISYTFDLFKCVFAVFLGHCASHTHADSLKA